MAAIDVVFYAEAGSAPALEWLLRQPHKVQDKFDFLIGLLEEKGATLPRPHAAPLRDKIYGLRVRHHRVHYRLLYFFAPGIAVLAHGCTKEGRVGDADIDRAVLRRGRFLSDPAAHRYVEP